MKKITVTEEKIRVRMFANGPGSIPGWAIPKTEKTVLDATLLNTQHYKVSIKGKVEQSKERSCAPLRLGVVATEEGAFGSPSTKVANFIFYSLARRITDDAKKFVQIIHGVSRMAYVF